jgi:predicted SAM-dependent methyltransferase
MAVPDGLNPDPTYQVHVRPPAQGHLSLFNHRRLVLLLEAAGFSVELLEWFDEQGRFHTRDWDVAGGRIERSYRFDERRTVSIIVDARKDSGK